METVNLATPRHLWIVGVIALLWNAFGAFDYLATQLNLEFYMANYTPEQRAYFASYPAWTVAAWAVGVWCALLGSVALLMRSTWAVWLYGASLLGMIVAFAYMFATPAGTEGMGAGAIVMTLVIWAVAIALFFYARRMAAQGVLQ